ncbi:MAG: hypothetical protein IJ374_12190 [Lachnospiraceae bacterium]|nr:hypothetical protein [Lachnospiraceae bacterium]
MIDSSKLDTADQYGCKFDIDINACSPTDCTGLIPSLPQSDAEAESYNQIYKYLPEHLSEPETTAN